MNAKKAREYNNEELLEYFRSYPREYREKSDALVDRAKLVKTKFNSSIAWIRTLLKDTPLAHQDDYILDDTQKKELEECQKKWDLLMIIVDNIEITIKNYTNELLWCFQGNAKGKVIRGFYMIKETGYEDADNGYEFTGTEGVPDVLSLCLFDIQAFLLLFSSCAVTAWQVKQDIIAIFENDPFKIRERINKGVKPILDFLFEFKKQMDDIKKEQENTQRKIDVQGDRSSRENKSLKDDISKRNKADKRKPLTQEDCAVILFRQKGIYLMKRQRYLERIGITKTKVKSPKNDTTVLRTIQRWDQYLATDGEKGIKPPKYYSREKSQKEFEIWAEDVEREKYQRWEMKQPMIMRKNMSDGQVDTHFPEFEEDREEEEDVFETRGQEDLVEGLKRRGIK